MKELKIHLSKKDRTSQFPNFLLITFKVVNYDLNPQFKSFEFELEGGLWTSVLITLKSSSTWQELLCL